MSGSWREDDEEFRVGGVRGGLRSKPRFSFTEVKLLLEAVKRNRYIILRKFNHGVSAETKKQTWAEITNQINGLGENHREVRQIMKKWADLKCDGKRRIIALRGPNGNNLRKKNLGPVEKMVHKILMMSPTGDGDSDPEFGDDDDFPKLYNKGPPSNPSSYSYLSLTDTSYSLPGGASFDISPLSSPEKELGDPFHSSSDFDLADDGECTMDFDENDDSVFSSGPPAPPPPPPPASTSLDPLPDDALLRVKPVHTYSRNSGPKPNHAHNHASPRLSPSEPSTSSGFPSASDADAASSSAAAAPQSPSSSNVTADPAPSSSSQPAAANDSTSQPAPSTSAIPPPPASSAAVSSSSSSSSVAPAVTSAPSAPSSNSHQPSPSSSSSSTALPPGHPSSSASGLAPNPSDPLPAGASSRRAQDHVAQMASQSLQQQRAGRMLLTSVSQSLEVLAQSVQLLVESQQEFVQESLLLQRETVDILRDFSNTALAMLRDKANSGQAAATAATATAATQQPASRF